MGAEGWRRELSEEERESRLPPVHGSFGCFPPCRPALDCQAGLCSILEEDMHANRASRTPLQEPQQKLKHESKLPHRRCRFLKSRVPGLASRRDEAPGGFFSSFPPTKTTGPVPGSQPFEMRQGPMHIGILHLDREDLRIRRFFSSFCDPCVLAVCILDSPSPMTTCRVATLQCAWR